MDPYRGRKTFNDLPDWLQAVLLVFSASIVGLAVGALAGTSIPFWILFGFTSIYSIEKWFPRATMRKYPGRLYRLYLNLTILSTLGLLVWSSVHLFSGRFVSSPLVGTIVVVGELVFFVWLWRVVAKNSWRWPSMKLTITCLAVLFLVAAFAGVQPLSSYKDKALAYLASAIETRQHTTEQPSGFAPATTTSRVGTAPTTTLSATARPSTVLPTGIDPKTGQYKNYSLGLVKAPEGTLGGTGCYSQFVVLINNRDAKDPSYYALLDFLRRDRTDQFPYRYVVSAGSSYYGTAESHVDLARIKDIIDGKALPGEPRICADFAERLHNEAEKAGIRCAYVSLDITGYADPNGLGIPSDAGHACVAFQTTDRGLVYIDDTGISTHGPSSCDKSVDVKVGTEYMPRSLFPEPGWSDTWNSMGMVTGIFMTWDGNWNN